jgi:hypothetical protein
MSSLDLKPVERSAGLFNPGISFKVDWTMSYVSNIANSILSHSGDAALLGPEIYTAIAEWEKREIPAAVVLSSIEEVYMHIAEAEGVNIPVEMFQDAVFRNFRTWLLSGEQAFTTA